MSPLTQALLVTAIALAIAGASTAAVIGVCAFGIVNELLVAWATRPTHEPS